MSDPPTLRPMSEQEVEARRALAHSRTSEARLRDRARICWLSHGGQPVAAIKDAVGVADGTVRFDREGRRVNVDEVLSA